MTKVASGYWQVSDTQTGFTAISLGALEGIKIHEIYHTYGMPNDMLVKLNIGSFTIKEVPIKPIYNVGEKSKMVIWKTIPKIMFLLLKSFNKRMFHKYLIRNFHPLFICYFMFFITFFVDGILIYNVVVDYFWYDYVNKNWLITSLFLSIMNIQFLLFGMWFDIQDNARLQK